MSKRPNTDHDNNDEPTPKRAIMTNHGMPMSNRLMVYVRVKPLQDDNPDWRTIIHVEDEKTLIFDPVDQENQSEYYYHGKKYKQIGSRPNKNASFVFDKVFNNNATNYYIYETVTKPMVQATINGLNCSVFAYGATGSGKTHTMLGSPNYPGVIYYTSKELFQQILELNKTELKPAELEICYFEIYNENVRDLLQSNSPSDSPTRTNCNNNNYMRNFYDNNNNNHNNHTNHNIHSNHSNHNNFKRRNQIRSRNILERLRRQEDGVIRKNNTSLPLIRNMSFYQPSTPEELLELLEIGNTNRSQHPTDANADSSRSHAIFQIVLTRRLRSSSQDITVQTSKMSLIDLAGSERATVAHRAGIDRSKKQLLEGSNINKSLLALGNCIKALAGPKRPMHVPYFDSKLTLLLRDSLGGNCRTAMVATICQQPSHYDDTRNTLEYASLAKCIKLNPHKNLTKVNIPPRNYSNIMEQNAALAREIERLKNAAIARENEISAVISENEKLKRKNEQLERKLRQRVKCEKRVVWKDETNNNLPLRRLSRNLTSTFEYTPEQSNITFDVSNESQ